MNHVARPSSAWVDLTFSERHKTKAGHIKKEHKITPTAHGASIPLFSPWSMKSFLGKQRDDYKN
jgi:hypothetical protein